MVAAPGHLGADPARAVLVAKPTAAYDRSPAPANLDAKRIDAEGLVAFTASRNHSLAEHDLPQIICVLSLDSFRSAEQTKAHLSFRSLAAKLAASIVRGHTRWQLVTVNQRPKPPT
jgi:hypothetical protein